MARATNDTDHLQEVIAFLSDPRSYRSRPSKVERLETHGAYVFLAGDDAIKIKKPVRFSYMDFSTLARRRRACEREFALNKPHAPEIYRELVAIVRRRDGHLAFGRSGKVLEWAVRMRRFRQQDLLGAVADQGPLDPRLCEQLADAVHAFHAQAHARRTSGGAKHISSIAHDVIGALAQFKEHPAHHVTAFAKTAKQEIERLRTLLEDRATEGYVRRCHGDLHLGNIVLWKGAPVLFDALEFDDEMATVDTLYDLAFLLMDLEHRGQRVAANRVFNRYLWRQRDPDALAGLAALPLFLALRAAIRAMVTAQQAEQRSGAERKARFADASAYLHSALALLAPRSARLIAIGGLSGTGKSTLGAALAPGIGGAPGALHVRSDLERKAIFGKEATERLSAKAYRPEVSAKVYDVLARRAEVALNAGHSVIVDAVFATPSERQHMETLARRAGVPFQGIWLEAPAQILKLRVAQRRNDASDATEVVVDKQLRCALGPIGWSKLQSGGAPDITLSAAQQIISHLKSS